MIDMATLFTFGSLVRVGEQDWMLITPLGERADKHWYTAVRAESEPPAVVVLLGLNAEEHGRVLDPKAQQEIYDRVRKGPTPT